MAWAPPVPGPGAADGQAHTPKRASRHCVNCLRGPVVQQAEQSNTRSTTLKLYAEGVAPAWAATVGPLQHSCHNTSRLVRLCPTRVSGWHRHGHRPSRMVPRQVISDAGVTPCSTPACGGMAAHHSWGFSSPCCAHARDSVGVHREWRAAAQPEQLVLSFCYNEVPGGSTSRSTYAWCCWMPSHTSCWAERSLGASRHLLSVISICHSARSAVKNGRNAQGVPP